MSKYHILYHSSLPDGQIWNLLYDKSAWRIDDKLANALPNDRRDILVTVEVKTYWDEKSPRKERAVEFVTRAQDFWSSFHDALRDDFTALGEEAGDSDFAYHVTGITASYV